MAGRRKPRPAGRAGANSLSQYGLFDVPGDLDDVGGGSEADSDLEAELAALSGGGGAKAKPKAKPKPKLIPERDLNNLIAESMRDIPSDEEVSDGDDDPDLLNELSELAVEEDDGAPLGEPRTSGRSTPPSAPASASQGNVVALLQERIEMYATAEQNAKAAGDSTRARRFGRGLKTLKDQLKQAKAGKVPNDDDIPPPVSTAKPSAPDPPQLPSKPARPAPEPPRPPQNVQEESVPDIPKEEESNLSEEAMRILKMLEDRKSQFKIAALTAKKSGDNATALSYVKITKQFDKVIEAVKAGQPVDLSNMPMPPGAKQPAIAPISPQKEDARNQRSTDTTENNEETMPEGAPVTLISANSAEEALRQRLDLYKEQMSAASESGNSSKARRMGRIVKQYEQAIKLHAAGKPIPFDELPTPPGYAPIPGAPAPAPEEPPAPVQPGPASPKSPPAPAPSTSSPEDRPGKLANAGRSNSVRKMGNHLGTGHAEKQLSILLLRQQQFKEAALNAKKKGEIPEAKEYLRCAKGLEPLIDAAQGGLPVDLSTVPLPPQAKQELEDSYDIVTADDCDESSDGLGDILARLEEQLTSQLKLCMSTRDHHKALGDVAGANRFEHLALSVKQDLDIVKLARRQGGGNPPKFHYETRQFSVVQSCTDLGDNDLEVTIVRGINYTVSNPKDVDTYVKFEFPYPQEEPVKDKTALVKNTNNPEYNSTFVLPINRSQRPCVRMFKRGAIKMEVYSRGGLFARDSVIGTVLVKLQPLETQTTLHDSFDLMDGRKAVGGKLEVKVRVRHPMLTKQIEQTTQKWLLIDH